MFKNGDILQNRYQILQEIGAGGIGVIFLAQDLNLEKYVVVKKIKENFVENLETRSEVDILKNLHHTYLPQVYDFFQNGKEVYTVMDYIQGCDLQQYLQQGIRVPQQTIVRWLNQLLEVLSYLHGQKPPIYHCDIKPANIMITPDNDVCLIDFNISLGDDEKMLKGLSRWYSAPEQLAAAAHPETQAGLDQRMDIFSLGASFYALMTGYYPDTEAQSIWTEESRRLYEEGLIGVIDKAMVLDRKKRFSTAEQMKKALANLDRWGAANRRFWRVRFGVYAAAAVIITSGGCVTAYGVHRLGTERWEKAFDNFEHLSGKMDEDTVISSGIALLNSRDAERFMTVEEKSSILWQIGDGYYLGEEYGAAAEYYREAWECSQANTNLCMDCAVALIRDERLEEAADFIDGVKSFGFGGNDFTLLEGEMLLEQGSFEEAFQAAQKVLGATRNEELQFHACVLAADACIGMNDRKAGIEWLQKAAGYESDRGVMRRIMNLAVELSRTQADGAQYTELAVLWGQKICAGWPLSDIDRINLAVVQIEAGQEDDAKENLLAVLSGDGELYQAPMYLALLSWKDESRRQAKDRDYREFLSFGALATEQYEASGAEKDAQMEDLKGKIQRVQGGNGL